MSNFSESEIQDTERAEKTAGSSLRADLLNAVITFASRSEAEQEQAEKNIAMVLALKSTASEM